MKGLEKLNGFIYKDPNQESLDRLDSGLCPSCGEEFAERSCLNCDMKLSDEEKIEFKKDLEERIFVKSDDFKKQLENFKKGNCPFCGTSGVGKCRNCSLEVAEEELALFNKYKDKEV